MTPERADGWHRLHPLSPVVRGGRGTIAIAILLLPIVFSGGRISDAVPQVAIIAVLALGGFVSWLVTRWRIEDDDLRIETGLLRRQSLRFPLAQVQAIDVVRPGLARMFRVAELRLRMAGASGATARLAYVGEREVDPLRDRLLALARGARVHEGIPAGEAEVERPPERVLAVVATGPLVASILLERGWLILILAGLLSGFVASPKTAAAVIGGGGFVWAISIVTVALAPVQPAVPPDRCGGRRGLAPPRRPGRADRGGDPARPRAGRPAGRAVPLAAARLVPARGRPRGTAAAQGRGRGGARPAPDAAAGRAAGARIRAHRPARARTGPGSCRRRRGACAGRALCATGCCAGDGATASWRR